MGATTTLNRIWEVATSEELKSLLQAFGKAQPDDVPIPFVQVVEAIGFEVASMYVRTLEIHDSEIRLLACDIAEMVLPLFEAKYPEEDFPHRAIEAAASMPMAK